VECIATDVDSRRLAQELSTGLLALHACRPEEFRARARTILSDGVEDEVIAATNALRVQADDVTWDDISLLELYLAFPDSRVKWQSLHAIAYMGKTAEVQPVLLRAVLGVEVEGMRRLRPLSSIRLALTVLLTQLSVDDLARLLTQLASVEDFSVNQGRIPSFLSRLSA
jgi:hypothetical protein